MKLRIRESDWTPFAINLSKRTDVESAGVILAERLHGGDVLLAQHLVEVPDDGYLIRRLELIRIDPIVLNRLIRPARDRGMSVVTVHTHPGSNRPWFSAADDLGDGRLMPSLYNQMVGPHGSVVIAGDSMVACGRVCSPDSAFSSIELAVVGRSFNFMRAPEGEADKGNWFARQELALGRSGQAILRELRVGVVGLGGTGSVAFAQLAHLGVQRLTLIDGDKVEASNVSRILGATVNDVGREYKVDVAARYAMNLGLGTQVNALRGHVGHDVQVAELENCDVILSCVDRHLPRALLNRLAYEKAVPLIDMGNAFRVDGTGRISASAGRVVVIGPERPCLACWGHLNPDRIRIESLSETDFAREVAEGYIIGAEESQPSVIAFNTHVAGAAVIELLRMTTKFSGADNAPLRLNFDFDTGIVSRNRVARGADCQICKGAGR
jgi:hypothetical protein